MSPDILKHYPVMLSEVAQQLENNTIIADCTFGGGGYSSHILENFTGTKVIGIDRDNNALKYADKIKAKFDNRFDFFNYKFSQIHQIKNFKDIDYFIFDLGVSNFQLKDHSRGFSFNSNFSLDMRMGLNSYSAKDLINNISEGDLKNILKFFGEEKFASVISKSISLHRNKKKIELASELASIIKEVKFKKGKTDPATRSIQAIRMIVNNEFSEIYKTLKYIIETSKIGSKIIIISFHSLEDLLVKKIFNLHGKKKSYSRYVPLDEDDFAPCIKIITSKPIVPSNNEIKKNPPSRSAKLRVAQKITQPFKQIDRKDLKLEKYFNLEQSYG